MVTLKKAAPLSSQESCESHAGPATSAGHHLHALLRESGGGRYLTDRFHLFQLLFTVFSGENNNNKQYESHQLVAELYDFLLEDFSDDPE